MKKRSSIAVVAVLSALIIGSSLPAYAAGADGETDESSISQYLIDHPETVVVDDAVLNSPGAVVVDGDGATVDILGEPEPTEADPSDPAIVGSDSAAGESAGRKPAGSNLQSESLSFVSSDSEPPKPEGVVAAAGGCSYANALFANLAGWNQSVDGCSIIGWDWNARWGYSWSQDIFAWNSGPSCVQGRGYSTNHSVSTPVWFNAGCGSTGGVSAFIGNRATVAKIRGHVNAAGKLGYVRWR